MDSSMKTLPEELDRRIRTELRQGERLVWSGQPIPRRFMRSTLPIVLFGIPWTAFALFWMAGASGILFGGFGGDAPGGFGAFFTCFPLFGVPFVLIGLGMLSSPYWMYRRARRTCYALTNQRALVWAAGWFSGIEIRSFRPSALGKMARREFSDGSGDLIFEEFFSVSRNSDGDMRSQRTERGFLGIENVREVEELVRKTLPTENEDG
jgi:hypothetical protein